jgi:hypothetical protein
MRRHLWIEPKVGTVGGGKGRAHCVSCGLIRWTVAAASAITLTALYGRDGLHWTLGPPGPCERRA